MFSGVEAQLNETESRLQETQQALRDATEAYRLAHEEHESYFAAYKSNAARRDELAAKLDAYGRRREDAYDCLEGIIENNEAISEQGDSQPEVQSDEDRKIIQQ